MTRSHNPFVSLNWTKPTQVVYVALSKQLFYLRSHISSFVLQSGATPISPFMNFDYNLAGIVDRDLVRVANNTLLGKADALWVFGPVSDGVLIEIYLALRRSVPVRYFQWQHDAFEEISVAVVRLEDVSSWMWQMVQDGGNLERWHPRLRFHRTYPLVYPAYSKRNFYWQMHISKYCLQHKTVPLNPFMLFRYFLGDSVPRETVYRANNTIVQLADAVWTFGEIADGVLAEVKLKLEQGGSVQYYGIQNTNPVQFRRITAKQVEFEEPELEQYRELLQPKTFERHQ